MMGALRGNVRALACVASLRRQNLVHEIKHTGVYDNYEIVREIGHGMTGKVHEVKHRLTNEVYALKCKFADCFGDSTVWKAASAQRLC